MEQSGQAAAFREEHFRRVGDAHCHAHLDKQAPELNSELKVSLQILV
jgi:hypothetical protein